MCGSGAWRTAEGRGVGQLREAQRRGVGEDGVEHVVAQAAKPRRLQDDRLATGGQGNAQRACPNKQMRVSRPSAKARPPTMAPHGSKAAVLTNAVVGEVDGHPDVTEGERFWDEQRVGQAGGSGRQEALAGVRFAGLHRHETVIDVNTE